MPCYTLQPRQRAFYLRRVYLGHVASPLLFHNQVPLCRRYRHGVRLFRLNLL
ncbi:hypothetical protein GGTG_03629 [Gaeumannomyces tritici R3-111a-1]|uniref:Uncharacterized protein n=1 Tax=Gaeumannomyces tritici (strain R3-111a-1) TaxID=644352 RepID=J3NQS3_GAET3|nr:hypothetical protein GGTG_03629 [Gaeumannomyces tritici R3-111a-1]EJT78529.1 hypothetical protein GGTG_03629 [Gaeumannomyces tritici R3-111a-1]